MDDYTSPAWKARLARNRAFVDEVNARTVCAHCGKQPIEWHNPEHVEVPGRQYYRISAMVVTGRAVAAIETEMARCIPLCRRCHLIEDGRMTVLRAQRPAKQPPKPCRGCGQLANPLSRGLCRRCYHRTWKSERKAKRMAAARARVVEGWI